MIAPGAPKPHTRLVLLGLASASLYALLYVFRNEIMTATTRTDGWYPALPVATAFLFSLVHGAFAGCFWEVLGVGRKRG